MTIHASIELIEAMEGVAPWASLEEACDDNWRLCSCSGRPIATASDGLVFACSAALADPSGRVVSDVDCPDCLVRMDEARIKVGGR